VSDRSYWGGNWWEGRAKEESEGGEWLRRFLYMCEQGTVKLSKSFQEGSGGRRRIMEG
jgi:hypothetical protein